MKKRLLILTTITLLLLSGCKSNSTNSIDNKSNKDYSIKYSLKINPEFEIFADENLQVVAIEPLNEDGETILSVIDVEGMNVTDAFSAITDEAKAQGFMTSEKGNTVNINIEEIDEETLQVCPVCEGCGTIKCWDCDGAGSHFCERCNSTGIIYEDDTDQYEWQLCSECGGLGTITTASSDCWACQGSGICYLCGGTGYDIVTNGDGEIVYISDGVPETSTCTFCHGSGSCTNCIGRFCNVCNDNGTGEKPGYIYEVTHYENKRECPDCIGTGKISCGCELNGYRWCPCCWGSGVDGTGYENYDYSLTPYENWLNNR